MKYYKVTFTIETDEGSLQCARDVLSAMAGEAGFESFEDSDNGVVGYVQQELFDRNAIDELAANFPLPHTTISFQTSEAEYKDWNEEWEKGGFDPIVVEGCCVIHDGRHLPEDMLDGDVTTTIEIDARQAFGTGTHATTQMMLRALAGLRPVGLRVLDCGTGTGILSIAALKFGASEAVGYDIDEWSVDNARHNAVINRVDARFTSLQGDASVLDGIEGTFDVVMANINRNILLADMASFERKMSAGGRLLLSGFYTADTTLLTDKAQSLGLSLTDSWQNEDWACLAFAKKG